jgi:hypothetical protein
MRATANKRQTIDLVGYQNPRRCHQSGHRLGLNRKTRVVQPLEQDPNASAFIPTVTAYNGRGGSRLSQEGSMSINSGLSQSTRSDVLAHLRSLRGSIAQAREALMHYKADRLDRDKLEPAARRVDDLMNMFAGEKRDLRQGSAWVAEVLGGVQQITNPKAAAALTEAKVGISRLIELMEASRPP